MKLVSNPEVDDVFAGYPDEVRHLMVELRNLIIETAQEIEEITELEETLRWGEPSYISKHGSTIRIDWKEKAPDRYSIYFKCTSKLVESFKEVFGDVFEYENTRAIHFEFSATRPDTELKDCIRAALMYHKVKNEPLLGLPY